MKPGPGRRANAAHPDQLLLSALADGQLHSGEELAAVLGVSRAAVWKRIHSLDARGAAIRTVRGRGYRLPRALELLQPDLIRAHLSPAARALTHLQVEFATDSTNLRLLAEGDCHGRVLVAEYQDAGRGRRGNRWESPPASGICLSLGWRLDPVPAGVAGLSILAGAATVRALQRAGVAGIGLKWPNDLVCERGKVGGLLIESRAQLGGAMEVIIGIGINVCLPGRLRVPGGNRPADLAGDGAPPSRNRIVALLVEELLDMLQGLARGNTGGLIELWRRHDTGAGRDAELHVGGEILRGRVLGITDAGLLRLAGGDGVREYASGELSLRLR